MFLGNFLTRNCFVFHLYLKPKMALDDFRKFVTSNEPLAGLTLALAG